MNEISRQDCRTIAAEAQAALEEVAARWGLSVKVGGGNYDPQSFRPKVEFKVEGADGARFAADAYLIPGLLASDFGREFTSNGRTFRVSGLNLRAPKYPLVGTDVKSGRTFKFTESVVERFRRDDAAAEGSK